MAPGASGEHRESCSVRQVGIDSSSHFIPDSRRHRRGRCKKDGSHQHEGLIGFLDVSDFDATGYEGKHLVAMGMRG
jgi:hypothetical protein